MSLDCPAATGQLRMPLVPPWPMYPRADVEAHLDGLAGAAHADLGVDAFVAGHALGDHVVVAREAARGDDDLLCLVLVQLLGAPARKDADDGAVFHDEGLGRGLVVELDANFVCLLRHCRDGNVRVRVDVVAARDRADRLLRDLLLERNAQLDIEPVESPAHSRPWQRGPWSTPSGPATRSPAVALAFFSSCRAEVGARLRPSPDCVGRAFGLCRAAPWDSPSPDL